LNSTEGVEGKSLNEVRKLRFSAAVKIMAGMATSLNITLSNEESLVNLVKFSYKITDN